MTKDGEKGQEWGSLTSSELSVTPHIYNLPYVCPPEDKLGREAAPGYRAEPATVQEGGTVFHPAPSTQKDTNEFKMLPQPTASFPPSPCPSDQDPSVHPVPEPSHGCPMYPTYHHSLSPCTVCSPCPCPTQTQGLPL